MNKHSDSAKQDKNLKDWNYHPTLPLIDVSIVKQLNNPRLVLKWFTRNWLTLSEFVLLALLSIFLYAWCYAPVAQAHEFNFGWISRNFFVNFALMLVVAGGLHGYFYIIRRQGKTLKFDSRDQTRSNRNFLFSDQVKDNMFWSLSSGVFHLTLFQSVTFWLIANSYVPSLLTSNNLILAVLFMAAGFVLLPIWSAFHFYWVHRLLHVPFMYKRIHSLHHKNINIGPWSGLSMHPVEHFLYMSSLCIHWVIPSHPLHVIFHIVWLGPGAAMSHTGYENLLVKDKRRLALGTFYHQLHHRYFECNYGNQELPWDRWFGTFHDGTEESTKQTRKRKKAMYS